MPGFAVNGSNGGIDNKDNRAEYRRKHRWRVTTGGRQKQDFWLELKSMQRPSVSFAEVEVHHDQEVAYFAGKTTWEPITFTFYDRADSSNDISRLLYESWIQNSVNIDNATVMPPRMYKLPLKFISTDGKGVEDEEWTLHGAWVSKANWQDLDYSNTEIQLVEVTVRFDRATRS